MSELIINGVDWLDPRMIGLKVVFKGKFGFYQGDEYDGVLYHIGTHQLDGHPFEDAYGNQYRTCLLAQGDKTPYDGKGQPVPDGVMVKVWYTVRNACASSMDLSDTYDWTMEPQYDGDITHYQVQEQKLDVNQEQSNAEKAFQDAVLYGASAMKDGKHIPYEKTLPETITLPREVVERVKVVLIEYDRLLHNVARIGKGSKYDEIAQLEALLKEVG